MSWSQQLIPDIVRRAVPLLTGRHVATSPAVFLNGACYASRRFSHADFDLREILSKALGPVPGVKTPDEMWADKSNNLKLPPPPDAWTGRRVLVRNGELQSAFQQLKLRLRYNHVAKENLLAARHEKKGDKRARLRSARWRKQFANAVRKKVQLVSTIRRRGG